MEIQGGPGSQRLFPSTTKHRQTLTCVWCSPPPFLRAFGKEKLHLPTLQGKKPCAGSAGQLLKAHAPKLRCPQEKGTRSSVMYAADTELRNFPPLPFSCFLSAHQVRSHTPHLGAQGSWVSTLCLGADLQTKLRAQSLQPDFTEKANSPILNSHPTAGNCSQTVRECKGFVIGHS